jgi:DNA-nicking Smr family endonuclease
LVAHSPRPVILAGGLNPDNVREAILTVRPVEVDVHTGVEDSCGRKRRYLVSAFVAAALEAFQDLQTSDDQIQSARELLQVPITDTLDLHTFKPREVSDLLPEYIRCCLLAGYSQLRIIHGKGTGILRNRVHHILKEQPEVVSFSLADVSGGSWGATIVYLKQSNQITK